jgi:hypothetical protein
MMYAVVLGSTMVVAVIGMSALMAVRVERQSAQVSGDLTQARYYAESAIQVGLGIMQNDPQWRTNLMSGPWRVDEPLGTGRFSLEGIDPLDGNLADSAAEPVELTGTGVSGSARYIMATTVVASPKPLAVLTKAAAGGADVQISLAATFQVSGAPLSINTSLKNLGVINGNVETGSVATQGSVLGTVTSSVPPKPMPDPGVFDLYKGIATPITYFGDIDRMVFSPGLNSRGATNSEGVYFIEAGSQDLKIKRSRIHGTLLVKVNAGRRVILEEAVLLHNYRSNYPVLIVQGNLEVNMLSTTGVSELVHGVNLNPPGAPYQGTADSDQLDAYPNEVQGLVHVTGTLTMDSGSLVRGGIICEGKLTAGASSIIYDATLHNDPPMGYCTYEMAPARGSWKRVVLP